MWSVRSDVSTNEGCAPHGVTASGGLYSIGNLASIEDNPAGCSKRVVLMPQRTMPGLHRPGRDQDEVQTSAQKPPDDLGQRGNGMRGIASTIVQQDDRARVCVRQHIVRDLSS